MNRAGIAATAVIEAILGDLTDRVTNHASWAAGEDGKPLLFGTRTLQDWSLDEQLCSGYSLAVTMWNLIAAGLSERGEVTKVAVSPACLLLLEGELSSLVADSCADLVTLHEQPDIPLKDVERVERTCKLRHAGLVLRTG